MTPFGTQLTAMPPRGVNVGVPGVPQPPAAWQVIVREALRVAWANDPGRIPACKNTESSGSSMKLKSIELSGPPTVKRAVKPEAEELVALPDAFPLIDK